MVSGFYVLKKYDDTGFAAMVNFATSSSTINVTELAVVCSY